VAKTEKKNLERILKNSQKSLKNFSPGYILNIIANPEIFLNRELEKEEIRILTNNLILATEKTYNTSLKEFIKKLKEEFNLKNFKTKKITNEYELLLNFKKNIGSIDIFEKFLQTKNEGYNIRLSKEIKKKFKNLERIRNHSSRNNNIYIELYDISENIKTIEKTKNQNQKQIKDNKLTLEGLILIKKKLPESFIIKYILEYSELRFPSKKHLKEIRMYNERDISKSQLKYYNYIKESLLIDILKEKEIHHTFSKKFSYLQNEEKELTNLIKFYNPILNTFFTDFVGCKIIVPRKDIPKIISLCENTTYKPKKVKHKCKDNLSKNIKDKSIVYVFKDEKLNSSFEVRINPFEELINTEFGENAHYKYKQKCKNDCLRLLNEKEELNKIAANLMFAFNIHPYLLFDKDSINYKKYYSKYFEI